MDDGERWTTISAAVLPGETIEEAIARCVGETLGAAMRARRSPLPQVGVAGQPPFAWSDDAPLRTDRGEIEAPCAVELQGRLVPQGPARRFTWFLVTALPMRGEVSAAQWALLADLLEAQGEPGLAARMRQF